MGSGLIEVPCDVCGGYGEYWAPEDDDDLEDMICDYCGGTGKVYEEEYDEQH